MKAIITLSAIFGILTSISALSAEDSCWKLQADTAYDQAIPRSIRLSKIQVEPIDATKPTGSPDDNGGSNLRARFSVMSNEDGVRIPQEVVVSVDDVANQGFITLLSGTLENSVWSIDAALGPWGNDTAIEKITLSPSGASFEQVPCTRN